MEQLQRDLALYRLAFGQPRQEDISSCSAETAYPKARQPRRYWTSALAREMAAQLTRVSLDRSAVERTGRCPGSMPISSWTPLCARSTAGYTTKGRDETTLVFGQTTTLMRQWVLDRLDTDASDTVVSVTDLEQFIAERARRVA